MSVAFSKALNRSVTGHMNDFVYHAKCCFSEGGLLPEGCAQRLNQIPLLDRDFIYPREGFQSLGL